MQGFADSHPVLFWFGTFIPLWLTIGYAVALLSGWRSLAEHYRTDRPFPGHKRWMQSAKLRLGAGYNNALTLGSDADGIYMAVLFLFRMGHPPLFIPWGDIQIDEPKRFLFLMSRKFRLGPDGIPLRVREPLAQFLLQANTGAVTVPRLDAERM